MQILAIGLLFFVGWLVVVDRNMPIPKPKPIIPKINVSVSPTLTPTQTTKPDTNSSINQNTNNSLTEKLIV